MKLGIIFVSTFLLLIVFIYMGNSTHASEVGAAFNKREGYRNKTQLGNPADTKNIINKDQDSSHLQNLNDSNLMNQGSAELRNNPAGKFLQESEEKKIDASMRYKINEKNSWLKDSLAIEENSMGKTGGKDLKSTESIIAEQIKKTCTEGVDFNVDVGLELVLESEEVEYLGAPEQKKIDIHYWEVPGHWWSHGNHYGHGCQSSIMTINSTFNNEITGFIAARLEKGNARLITVPNQNILLSPTASLTRNADISNCSRGPFSFVMTQNAIIHFHYNSQEKFKKLVEKGEYWRVATEGMEQLAESNECYETARVCQKSGSKTFFGKYEVSRPCWYEKISYRCQSEPKEGCAHLINQGCRLHNSSCEYQIGSICLRWKRDYMCAGVKKQVQYSMADSPIYCLGGDCHTPTLEADKDFANVAYLAALNEAKNDCTKEPNGLCKNPITVFGGQIDGCKKIILSFVDCCTSMKGWGKSVNLCRCSGGEKGLALKRDRGLCHSIGTHCSKRAPVFRNCLEKTTNFCCFSSKLARIFQEQGRKQLGISWGSAENPNCRPLTLEELTRLDFSKFDMEELFDALLNKGKSNQNKKLPALKEKEIPPLQKEHMAPSAGEKRGVRNY